jgi:hypothetical protein
MIKYKKLPLTEEQKKNLPVFYQFVTYNNMVDSNAGFNRDLLFFTVKDHTTSFPYSSSDKPISKIIDFSQIKSRVSKSSKT